MIHDGNFHEHLQKAAEFRKTRLELDKLKEEIKHLKSTNKDYHDNKVKANIALVISLVLAAVELIKWIVSLSHK